MLSLPFALVGGLWLMWWLDFNLSVAVAVGFIALAGVAAETGVVMLIYLNQALAEIQARRAAEGWTLSRIDLREAIMAIEALGASTRAAFYLASDEGTSIHHVVGMPASGSKSRRSVTLN